MREIITIVLVLVIYDLVKGGLYFIIRKRKWDHSELGQDLRKKTEDLEKVGAFQHEQ